MQLERGAFQSLFDEYFYKKYKFTNIQTLGAQTANNKPTKGTLDAYVLKEDGKYILINYGSLKEELKGYVYMEHREHIEEYRKNLEEYKRKVELRDYPEEADYA